MSQPKRAAHLTPAARPDTPEWADETIRMSEGRLAHVAEVGRVLLLPYGADHLVVRVLQRLHAVVGEESLTYLPGVAAVDVRRVADGTSDDPGLMTSQRAAELAALLTRAAELAARIGGGR
ncbi:hypothetical protein [Umezawaea sp.]|uniref:hypothetical protein n=1 Tax=Umezawaea sp. TaxID=1955258 RepID=UPI002ED4537E